MKRAGATGQNPATGKNQIKRAVALADDKTARSRAATALETLRRYGS
jgi:hypothetical protein